MSGEKEGGGIRDIGEERAEDGGKEGDGRRGVDLQRERES